MTSSGHAERLVDLALYAPVGLAVRAREELPSLISTGRAHAASRVETARMVGRVAVEQGRRLLRERLEAAIAGRRAAQSTPGADARAATPAPAASTPAPAAADAAGAASPRSSDLAIDHYDSLAAAQVVDLLPSLSPAELDDVERYERAHRNRRTILGKIAQLRG